MRAVGVALVLGVLLLVSGCGEEEDAAGSTAARPSVEAITASLLKVGDDPETSYTADEADCIAEILVASDLSDSALTGIAAGKPGFEKSEEDDTRYRALVPKISACLVGSLPKPSRTG